MENKQQEGLEAARAEAVKQYKALDEHISELMVAHKADMKMYRNCVKDTKLLKDL